MAKAELRSNGKTNGRTNGKVSEEALNSQINASFKEAVELNYAVIEFEPDGTIIRANDIFLKVLGYNRGEVLAKHHRIFCDKNFSGSPDYVRFWSDLAAGISQSGEFKRITKNGDEVWISAVYCPIKDRDGNVFRVCKVASDITETKQNAMMKQMVDMSPINTMTATKDGVLNYMNDKSFKTLKSIQEHLPGKVDDYVGSSIDMFHKNPSHQRRIIADPKNLPITSKIKVGPETLDLLVVPLMDFDGNYVGPMVTWSVITEEVKMAKDFERVVQSVTDSSATMLDNSQALAAGAEETAKQSISVSNAAQEASRSVQSVAAAAEEMSKSVEEISARVQESANMARNAAGEANKTNEMMSVLAASSEEIGQVVKVIASIAQQTNLLALNATIEAARAGEAGKGFAVVANEVKELARQTSKATEDINQKITAVQKETDSAVRATSEITKIINNLSDISVKVASSVEEQNAATAEISRSSSEAARGTDIVTENISEVTKVAEESGRGASQIQKAASELSEEALNLKKAAAGFLSRMLS